AVLSHEFGHFAQKTMAVGRWVYVAQQVANQLIYHRDALDKFLGVLSSLDLRIAWIGWLLQLIVWSLRSILDSLLSFVMLAERALSREMEFQADLVAVSTTGSDALIHGLFRLPAADQAWSETLDFMGEELGQDRKVANAFVVQKKILAHKQRILDDPNFGDVPPLPDSNRESNRIFSADIAQPPQMWATHPLSHFREANAKERYIPAVLDDRDAWDVFLDRDKLGTDLTSHMLKGMEQKLAPLGETIQRLDEKYDKEYYQPKYRGIYLDRSLCDHAKTPSDLLTQGGVPENVSLYPESLVEDLEKLRNTQKEKAMLVALRDRTFESSDGVIRFRGQVIKRARLGNAIEISENDIENCRQRLCEHDRVCRSLHMDIARSQPGDWAPYLTGLLEAIHYADHKLRDAIDANRKLSNTYAVVIADGNVSNNEVQRLVVDASNLYSVIREVYEQRATVYLDPTILQGMKKDSWSDLFEKEFRLPSPNGGNIGDWLNAIEGWVGEVCHAMSILHEEALEQLLKTEAMLSAVAAGTMEPGQAPKPSMFPKTYRTLLHGEERDLQKKLGWWDSFQTASGFGPATLRFCVAAVIVGAAIYVTFPPAWRYWIESFLGVAAY
ncbi:MAG: M48 family metalloprotease, partial [Verrucomicrobiota bacterium]